MPDKLQSRKKKFFSIFLTESHYYALREEFLRKYFLVCPRKQVRYWSHVHMSWVMKDETYAKDFFQSVQKQRKKRKKETRKAIPKLFVLHKKAKILT